jgi:hypothetical protein
MKGKTMSNQDPKENQNTKKQDQPSKPVTTTTTVPERPPANVTKAQRSADIEKENRSRSDDNG